MPASLGADPQLGHLAVGLVVGPGLAVLLLTFGSACATEVGGGFVLLAAVNALVGLTMVVGRSTAAPQVALEIGAGWLVLSSLIGGLAVAVSCA